MSAQEITGRFFLPPEWRGRRDLQQSPAERNNALAWPPSISQASPEEHARCPPRQSHEGRINPVPKVHPHTQYQPQKLFIVPQKVTGDVDVNGREIQTRCPRALSKQAHINAQLTSRSCLVSNHCGYPRTRVIASSRQQCRGRDSCLLIE